MDTDDTIDNNNFCDCDEDNKCGCSYPNNTGIYSCQYANLHNIECASDVYLDPHSLHYDICNCSEKGGCECHNN
ncbi:MAG: hypothetical protein IJ184_01140 [Alphaproteobacteria bacterium]|nr:hypothetical protein [Alphaproteobacteria bacterium]